jgi:hypothetical protein
MDEPRPSADVETTRRLQAGERATLGVIAEYIHELSERHAEQRGALRADQRDGD